jgi:hypothetical protein
MTHPSWRSSRPSNLDGICQATHEYARRQRPLFGMSERVSCLLRSSASVRSPSRSCGRRSRALGRSGLPAPRRRPMRVMAEAAVMARRTGPSLPGSWSGSDRAYGRGEYPENPEVSSVSPGQGMVGRYLQNCWLRPGLNAICHAGSAGCLMRAGMALCGAAPCALAGSRPLHVAREITARWRRSCPSPRPRW